MIIKTLYKSKDMSFALEGDTPTGYVRIIAGEGKSVTQDGINIYAAIDTTDTRGWYEVDTPSEDDPLAELEALYG